MRKTCELAVALACLASSGLCADRTLTYAAGNTALGDGLLTFEYSGDTITRIVANVPSGDRVLLKGDALSFAPDAVMTLKNGCDLVVSNAVSGAGDLAVRSTAESAVATYSGDLLDTEAYTVVLANSNLGEWEVVAASNTMPTSQGNSNPNLFCAYNEKRLENGKMTVQLQWCGSSYIKVIKLEFVQQGEDIAARILSAWNVHLSAKSEGKFVDAQYVGEGMRLGDDIDAVLEGKDSICPILAENAVHTPARAAAGKAGYGVNLISLRPVGVAKIRFAVGAEISGALTAGQFTDVYVENVAVATATRYNADGEMTLVNPVSGFELPTVGGCGKLTLAAEPLECNSNTETYTPFVTGSNTTMIRGRCLWNLTNATARMTGGSIGTNADGGQNQLFTMCNFTNTSPLTATGQFQFYQGTKTIKVVVVEFKQSGADILAKAWACYWQQSKFPGTDYSAGDNFIAEGKYTSTSLATSATVSGYGLHEFTFSFAESPRTASTVVLKTENVMTNYAGQSASSHPRYRTLSFRGVYAKPTGDSTQGWKAFPWNGLVEVGSGGVLDVSELVNRGAPAAGGSRQNDSAAIRISKGGFLLHGVGGSTSAFWTTSVSQPYDLNGGTFYSCRTDTTKSAYLYMSYLLLSDGARIGATCPVWLGTPSNATWRVRGTSPCYIDAPVQFIYSHIHTLDVADVTGNDAPDLFLNGDYSIRSSNPEDKGNFRKEGDGTVLLNGTWTVNADSILGIYGGTFKLGKSDQWKSGRVMLKGGALAAADGTSNSVGPLSIASEGGRIELGEGATLEFDDSSDKTWTAGATVTVSGFAEGAIRFGDSVAAVPRARGVFRTADGEKLRVNDDGYLTANKLGLAILIK